MDREVWSKAEQIFSEIASAPAIEQHKLLQERTMDWPAVRSIVEDLLDRAQAPESTPRFLADAWLFEEGVEESPLPEKIGSYSVKRLLGSGGMGTVFEAVQSSPHRHVAIKVLRSGFVGDRLWIRRFEREIEILGSLDHPRIATLYEAGRTEDGSPYFAMELVDGAPLDRAVIQAGFPLNSKLRLFEKICEAMVYAHGRGVIHRDLKPSNLIVAEDPSSQGELSAKVLDFGIAKFIEADNVWDLTQAGGKQGTPAYMSPEQAMGLSKEVDIRSEVYTLGVLLYQMVTGELPHRLTGYSREEALAIVAREPIARPTSVASNIPKDLEVIILRALAKEANRRYSTVSELLEDVRRFLQNKPIFARSDSAIYVVRKTLEQKKKAIVGLILFLLATASALVWYVDQTRRRSQSLDFYLQARQWIDFDDESFLHEAIRCLDEAIRLDPTNPAFYITRGQQYLLNSHPYPVDSKEHARYLSAFLDDMERASQLEGQFGIERGFVEVGDALFRRGGYSYKPEIRDTFMQRAAEFYTHAANGDPSNPYTKVARIKLPIAQGVELETWKGKLIQAWKDPTLRNLFRPSEDIINVAIGMHYGDAELKQRYHEFLLEEYKRRVLNVPEYARNPTEIASLGRDLHRVEARVEAEKALEWVVLNDPGNPTALGTLVDIYYSTDRFWFAKEHKQRELLRRPSLEGFARMAELCKRIGLEEESRNWVDKTMDAFRWQLREWSEQDKALGVEVFLEVSGCLFEAEAFEACLEVVECGLEDYPKELWLAGTQFNASAPLKRYDLAEKAVSVLLELDFPGALALRAHVEMWKGNLSACIDFAEKQLAEDPNHLNAALLRFGARVQLGEVDRAVEEYEPFAALESKKRAWRHLANGYRLCGDEVKCEATLRRLLAMDDSDPELHSFLAACLERQGRQHEANSHYQTAARIQGEN